MKSSSSSSRGCAHTNCGSMEAMLRQTPIAIRTRNDPCGADFDDVVADAAPWRLPRAQSWDGLAVCGGAGDAGAKEQCSSEIACSHCNWPRPGDRQRGLDGYVSRHDSAACPYTLLRRRGPGRPWDLLSDATLAPAVGPYAGGLPRPDRLVLSDGV